MKALLLIILMGQMAFAAQVDRIVPAVGESDSWDAVFSADGSSILFSSGEKIFLNETNNVQIIAESGQPGGISSDNRFVVFQSDETNQFFQIYLQDRASNAVMLISKSREGVPGNGHSRYPQISADGRWIVFESQASNFGATDTNRRRDLYLWSRDASSLRVITGNNEGAFENFELEDFCFSAEAARVVFSGTGTNLTGAQTANTSQIYARSLTNDLLMWASYPITNRMGYTNAVGPALSRDGRFLYFFTTPGPNTPSNIKPLLSRVDFLETSFQGVHLNVMIPSVGFKDLYRVSTSADGMFATYVSNHCVIRFRADTRTTEMVDVTVPFQNYPPPSQPTALNYSDTANISPDGRYVSFVSTKTNLITGQTNTLPQLYIRDMDLGITRLISQRPDGATADNLGIGNVTFSPDNKRALFHTVEQIAAIDTKGLADTYAVNLKSLEPQIEYKGIRWFEDGSMMFIWQTDVACHYQMEYAASLENPDWKNDGMPRPSIYYNHELFVAPNVTNGTERYFRFRLVPNY